jgi:ComF family protein
MKISFSFVKDLLFPKMCFGCSRLGSYLCSSCTKKFKLINKSICPYCQRGSYFGLTHPGCKRRSGLDGLESFFYYDVLVKKIVKNIKYRLVTEAIDDFLQAIPRQKIEELFFYKQLAKDFIFLPVPLHLKRERKRGFNQSEEMVKFFAQILKFPVNNKLIVRERNTKPQVELEKPKERYKNILSAFSLAKDIGISQIKGKNYIIFDDVWTTGWTIKEIARVLKKTGAAKIFALTIAR